MRAAWLAEQAYEQAEVDKLRKLKKMLSPRKFAQWPSAPEELRELWLHQVISRPPDLAPGAPGWLDSRLLPPAIDRDRLRQIGTDRETLRLMSFD